MIEDCERASISQEEPGVYERWIGAYRAIGDSEERKEHVVVSTGHQLAYHCLGVLQTKLLADFKIRWERWTYRVVGSLEKAEDDVVEIELPL